MVVRSWRRGSKSSCPNHLQILADMAILMEYIVVRYEQGGAHEHIAEAKRVPAPIGGNVSFSLYLSFKA